MLHNFVCKITLEFGEDKCYSRSHNAAIMGAMGVSPLGDERIHLCRIVGGRFIILNLFKYDLFHTPRFGQILSALRFVAIADFFRNQVVFVEHYL